jgi:hypothetical protein
MTSTKFEVEKWRSLMVHFEGDAQLVGKVVHLQEPDWSSMGVIIEDIKHELQSL